MGEYALYCGGGPKRILGCSSPKNTPAPGNGWLKGPAYGAISSEFHCTDVSCGKSGDVSRGCRLRERTSMGGVEGFRGDVEDCMPQMITRYGGRGMQRSLDFAERGK